MGLLDKFPGRVAVHGLIYNDGKILILKRSELDIHEANTWDPPGGGLEKGEDIERGFLRELKEETGIAAKNVSIFAVHEVDDGSMGLFARAETKQTKIRLSEEHSEYKWVKESELLAIKPASLHLRAIKELIRTNKRVINYKDTPKK